MKLIRFGAAGRERPGCELPDGTRIDVSNFTGDFGEAFFGSDGPARLGDWIGSNAPGCPRVSTGTRLGPPIPRPGKIVCIGLNFTDHAAESGMAPPAEPVIFFKSTTALSGPYDDVMIPKGGSKLDWEVELAVVIGRRATYVSEGDAMAHVAGYLLHNDYSERGFQLERGGQWVKGKSADTFAPMGPWLVTADEIPDPQKLGMWLTVNGSRVQDSSTAQMLFPVGALVSYVSQFMTLLPGDVISTGTPAGVALGMKPAPQYLAAGDIVELGIERLGTQRQRIVAWK